MKRNDEAYKVLWRYLNFLEHLNLELHREMDFIVLELKKYKLPK